MESAEKAIQFLVGLDRGDLATLLRFSTYQFVEKDIWSDITVATVEVISPQPYTDALSGLAEWDQKRIVEAITATTLVGNTGVSGHERVEFRTAESTEVSDADTLYPEIIIHRNQMIAVATGQKRIQEVNDYYRARHRKISAELAELGLADPNPHGDLWDWYNKWSAEFGSYKERRRYVNNLYEPLLQRLIDSPQPPVPAREPTGWDRVDRTVEKAQARLAAAVHEEDYQTIGLLCREILISLGQSVFDRTAHTTADGTVPSDTDAGRMIEGFLLNAASGGSNENVRRHARASLQLAVELQHKRTADFRAAALCLEATSSITNIIAILSGRRDPKGDYEN